MAKKIKFSLEIPIKCSPSLLFDFLSTANGLGEWFADKVDQIDKTYIFDWSGSKDSAVQLEKTEGKSVKYRWDYMDSNEYFEFRIERNDVINVTELIITDFAEKEEMQGQIKLWESQIQELKHRIGS